MSLAAAGNPASPIVTNLTLVKKKTIYIGESPYIRGLAEQDPDGIYLPRYNESADKATFQALAQAKKNGTKFNVVLDVREITPESFDQLDQTAGALMLNGARKIVLVTNQGETTSYIKSVASNIAASVNDRLRDAQVHGFAVTGMSTADHDGSYEALSKAIRSMVNAAEPAQIRY